jgi:competence ComEA-like helix-hairpin-helix protein
MPQRKKKIPEYLSFTRKERVGIIAVVVLMLVYPVIPFIYPVFIKPEPIDHTAFEKEIAALKIQEEDSSKGFAKKYGDGGYKTSDYQPSEKNYYNKFPKGELFYFDPNTLPEAGWVKLGVREKTAKTIQNYIGKGGRFYKPEDISKIWGLHEDEIGRFLPYVRIAPKPEAGFNDYKTQKPEKNYEKPKYANAAVDVNKADTAAFIALPGIGSRLAARIIAFREKLGGFYKIEQIGETYALPDSTFQKIKSRLVIGPGAVKKININTATTDELKMHPYIRYNIANAIVQYRIQHGSFADMNDLRKILMITDDIYEKALPYLTIK